MSSLRHQTIFTPFTASTTASRYPSAQSAQKKQKKMSLSQTYFLAHTARGKLSSEASRADHDLRLLVGHANLLDALMLDLHEAEREQEAWVEAAVSSASSASSAKKQPATVKWVDREMDLEIPDASDDESDSDSSDYEEDEDNFAVPLRRIRSPPPTKQAVYYNDEDDYSDEDDFYEDDEADASLSLVRTQSHSPDFTHHISASSSSSSSSSSEVPELVHDSDPESDDESSPPTSPSYPQLSLAAAGIVVTDFSSKTPQKPQVATTINEDFLHPNRQSLMVAAY